MNAANKISHEQRKKIFALSHQAGISNDDLHENMLEWAGAESLSGDLCTGIQAAKIISALQKIVSRPVTSYTPQSSSRTGSLTDKQLNAINAIKRALGWNDARVSGFSKHTVDKYEISDLSVREAFKLITGLRRMLPQ